MAKIVVTGGCGFIGSNLVRVLESGDHEVSVYDNLSKGDRAYLKGTNAKIIEGDVRDSESLTKALKGVERVVHLAASGSVVDSVQDPVENFDINARGTFTVLNTCREMGVSRVVFASTGGALIGNVSPPVSEASLPRPISPYGSSKLCGEAYCSSFAHSYGMNITALRFANVYGPYSGHKKGAVTAFMKAINSGAPIHIFGDGLATRDFLYVTDLCDGICRAQESDLTGFNVFHLASGREVPIHELAKSVARAAGKPDYPISFLGKRIGEVERNFARYDRAQQALGFSPKVELDHGLTSTWKWMIGHEFNRG